MDITCILCCKSMPDGQFYRHPLGRHGRMSKCKECHKIYVKENRLKRIQQYAAYEASRATLPHRVAMRTRYARTDRGKEAHARSRDAYIERYPLKRKAHLMVANAIRSGRLLRYACEVCNNPNAQAHHDDYTKPLDVRWLCTKHHAEWHRSNKPICPAQEEAA